MVGFLVIPTIKKKCAVNHQRQNFVQLLNYFGVNRYFCLKSNQVMENNDKLFTSGEIILENKTYGTGWAFFISNGIGFLITKYFLPNIWYIWLPVMLITTFGGFILYIYYIREKLFPNSGYRMRYHSIKFFDEYLIGLMIWKETWEDKIEFKDIKCINQKGSEEIIITFNDNFKPISSELEIFENRTQNYTISSRLSKQQKRELVNYLNERIKSQNNQ